MIKGYKLKRRLTAAALIMSLLCGLAGNAYATEVEEDTDTESEEFEETVGATPMNDEFRNINMYRWERFTGEFPRSKDPIPVMLVKNGSYLALKQNGVGAYFSPYRKEQSGNKSAALVDREEGLGALREQAESKFSTTWHYDGDEAKKSYFHLAPEAGRYNYEFETSDYLITPDRAISAESKDPMIHFDREAFFTEDDRNVAYVQYRGITGAENTPVWDMYIENRTIGETYDLSIKDTDTSSNYTDHPWNKDVKYYDSGIKSGVPSSLWTSYRDGVNRAYLKVTRRSDGQKGDGITISEFQGKYVFRRPNNFQYFLALDGGWLSARYCYIYMDILEDESKPFDKDSNPYRHHKEGWNFDLRPGIQGFDLYVAEKLHFSQLKGNTQVNDGMLLRISNADYVDQDGKTSKTMGSIIPNGATLTVNKGGMLVISGNLINNGTIINNGGTILVKKDGCISSFMQGNNISKNGCGTIKCNGGDILISKGGAIYAGMNDSKSNLVPFTLSNNSTLINGGLLVYGKLNVDSGSRVELRRNSNSLGQVFTYKLEHFPEKEYWSRSEAYDDALKRYGLSVADDIWGDYKGNLKTNKYGRYYFPEYTKMEVDGDYDILSNYISRLQDATSIPNNVGGLYQVTNNNVSNVDTGGMVKSSDSTIIQYNGAKLTDGAVKGVTKKNSLLID